MRSVVPCQYIIYNCLNIWCLGQIGCLEIPSLRNSLPASGNLMHGMCMQLQGVTNTSKQSQPTAGYGPAGQTESFLDIPLQPVAGWPGRKALANNGAHVAAAPSPRVAVASADRNSEGNSLGAAVGNTPTVSTMLSTVDWPGLHKCGHARLSHRVCTCDAVWYSHSNLAWLRDPSSHARLPAWLCYV